MALTSDLMARLADRASDPMRRHMTAAEDESGEWLPVEEIERRKEAWGRRLLGRSLKSQGRDVTPDEFERLFQEWHGQEGSAQSLVDDMARRWGHAAPEFKTLIETEDHFSVRSEPPGAKPLTAPPKDKAWSAIETALGRPIADEVKQLYAISDGGFGPGFKGLLSVADMESELGDMRRQGPDYCGTVAYPDSLVPLALQELNYHYDLDTGKIIASDQDWSNKDLTPNDILVEAFPDLTAFMEDWLRRS